MFGLETTIMLALQQGWPVAAGQPFFPADIQHAGQQLTMPYWMMTTPLHLKACVLEKLPLPGVCGIISSTMPLGAEVAAAAEAIWDVPVYEIYGCTEAGMMATRRPAAGSRLRLADDLVLQPDTAQGVIISGHRITGGRLVLADRISVHHAREFTLHGRASHLVKVAGKRMSLDALNQALNRIPGVQDGVFFDPAPELDNHGRLMAFAVAPDVPPAQIIAGLREQVDAVFLPRPLLLVDALPRTETGKLPRSHLVELAQRKLYGAAHE
jgi:acyl-coenzyme A synthetase/AMP-(fatty) acid ligase